MPTIQEFEIEYVRLTKQSEQNIRPRQSYDVLLAEWEAAGRPSDIEKFILYGQAEETMIQTEPTG